MKIKLVKEKSIKGCIEEAGSIVEVGDLVAQSLIDNGDAEELTPKTKKQKAKD